MAYTPPPYAHLPDVPWPAPAPAPAPAAPVPARRDINAVASTPSRTQAQVAAANAPLRVVYGETRIGAQIADALVYGQNLVVVAVWCQGEVESISEIWMGDAALPAGVTATHYVGSAGQTVNATLVAAYAAHGVAYADALPGIAYSVFVVPPSASTGFPQFAASIKGWKLFDPRTGLTTWSDNPALALADFLADTTYGWSRTVDWSGVAAAADACDELVGGAKRRRIGLCLDRVSECRQWAEALRAYAGCWYVQGPDGYRLVPERPASSVAAVGAGDIVAGSFKLSKRGVRNVPTVVEIRYTDTTTVPWAERSAIAYAPGVVEDTTPRRESQISLPGIQSYAQAYREAIERLNHLTLEDLEAEWIQVDEGLALQQCDVITVSHPLGLTDKPMRISAPPAAVEPGRWRIQAREYDPAAYSDSVEIEPTYPDTTLPNPAAPPAITGISAVEAVYQVENGTYSSRIRATWDAPGYPYVAYFRVEVIAGGELIQTGNTETAEWVSPAVQELVEYTVRVAVVTTVGTVGEWATDTVTAAGKYLIPGNVPSISAFEVGGRVYLSWEPAVDIDIWRYRLKYGPVGGNYADAQLLNDIDGLRYQTGDIPAGTWTLYCKAVDSVRQESETAATITVTVTLDVNAYLVEAYDHTAPTVSGMSEYSLGPTDTHRYWVSDDGITLDIKMLGTLDGYVADLASYHDGTPSAWVGEGEDMGLELSGTWTATGTAEALFGVATTHIEVGDNGVDYVQAVSPSTLATGRFCRTRHKTDGVMLVALDTEAPTGQGVRLDAVLRTKVGSGTSSASGPTTITLDTPFAAVKEVDVRPLGASALIGVPDNIITGDPTSFDAYVFDTAGNKVSVPFMWTWKGVG